MDDNTRRTAADENTMSAENPSAEPVGPSTPDVPDLADDDDNVNIDYITRESMTLNEAMDKLDASGYGVVPYGDGTVVAWDPDGNRMHLVQRLGHVTTIVIDHATREVNVHHASDRVIGESFGDDNPGQIAAVLGMVSDAEEEFYNIVGSLSEYPPLPKTTEPPAER